MKASVAGAFQRALHAIEGRLSRRDRAQARGYLMALLDVEDLSAGAQEGIGAMLELFADELPPAEGSATQ